MQIIYHKLCTCKVYFPHEKIRHPFWSLLSSSWHSCLCSRHFLFHTFTINAAPNIYREKLWTNLGMLELRNCFRTLRGFRICTSFQKLKIKDRPIRFTYLLEMHGTTWKDIKEISRSYFMRWFPGDSAWFCIEELRKPYYKTKVLHFSHVGWTNLKMPETISY